MLAFPRREPPHHADRYLARWAGRRSSDLANPVVHDRVVEDLAIARARQGLEGRPRVGDDGSRKKPGGDTHEEDCAGGKIVGGNAIPDMPDRRHARQSGCETRVECRLQRVRMHKVGVERANSATETERISRDRCESDWVESIQPDILFLYVP